jgi:ribosomal-protein-alanine N-acetyltransferase
MNCAIGYTASEHPRWDGCTDTVETGCHLTASELNQPSLQTDRLLLRPFCSQDVAPLVHLAGDRQVAATTLRIPYPYREQDAIDFVSSCQPDFELGFGARFAITIRDELCGAVGLHVERTHNHAELGYWIGVPYWGRGYATEAAAAVIRYGFDTLDLHRIQASVLAGNPASARVLLKVGMRLEGSLRDHVCKWEKFYDLEWYGILRSDCTRTKPSRPV